ncbi:rhamnogalacturonan acetylesterase [Nonomuraea bangladeshensis]|uniref:rhamnogalacturonan acetylesterase n=1 Tax=Nonomuraea bangladeshensis TaxID=404385 RepID=UPI003C2E2E5D
MRQRRPLLAVAALLTPLVIGSPALADGHPPRPYEDLASHCTGTSPIVCTFDVPTGNYDVTVVLGDAQVAAQTSVHAEVRRSMVPLTATEPGAFARRSFTVNVREPEGEPTGPLGTPGLTLTFDGPAPHVARIKVAPVRRVRRLFIAGDSTACDQSSHPYYGWGQALPSFLGRGLSVVNHADSGESSVTFRDGEAFFPAMKPRIQRGDLVLIQFGHNDKTTTAEDFRANLSAMVAGVRDQGGRPVLVTSVVRRRFQGTQLNDLGLIIHGDVNLPAETRAVAAADNVPLIDLTARTEQLVESLGPEGSKPIYLTDVNGDNTHLSEYGAHQYAALAVEELRAAHLINP